MKKIATILFSFALLFSPIAFNSQVEANSTSNQLVTTAPSDSETGSVQPFGTNPPDSSTSTHDISNSPYVYHVDKVGAQVYTDRFLKGKTTMRISVEDWKIIKGVELPDNRLYLTVYNASGQVVETKTVIINLSTGYGSASFSGLNSSAKYYVKFSVPLNGNNYSFNGSIY